MLSATPSLRRSTSAATVAATRAFSASSPSSSSSQSTTTSSSSSHNAINPLHYHLFCVAGRGADELVNPEPSSPSHYVAQQKFQSAAVSNPPPLPYRASSGCLLGVGGRRKRSRGDLVNVDPARIAKSAGAERGFTSSTHVRGVAEESLAEEDEKDGGMGRHFSSPSHRIPTPQKSTHSRPSSRPPRQTRAYFRSAADQKVCQTSVQIQGRRSRRRLQDVSLGALRTVFKHEKTLLCQDVCPEWLANLGEKANKPVGVLEWNYSSRYCAEP
ncbi:hypothetical protein JCM11641_001853 [Rhodosporidiobolus odoratus]